MRKLENLLLNLTLCCQLVNIIRILNIHLTLNLENSKFFVYVHKNIISITVLQEIIMFLAFWSLVSYTIIWLISLKFSKKNKKN